MCLYIFILYIIFKYYELHVILFITHQLKCVILIFFQLKWKTTFYRSGEKINSNVIHSTRGGDGTSQVRGQIHTQLNEEHPTRTKSLREIL